MRVGREWRAQPGSRTAHRWQRRFVATSLSSSRPVINDGVFAFQEVAATRLVVFRLRSFTRRLAPIPRKGTESSLAVADFDTAWKEALDTLFEPLMAFFFPDAHREIDWTQPHEMLEQELQEITPKSDQGRRVADKLVKVRRINGQVEWVLVHIEFQSQPETDFAKRMYVYNYRLFDRYNQKVASFAILGDDRPEWRPDRFGYELWGTHVGIRFPTAKLLDYARDEAALDSNANPIAVVVLAHLKTLQNAHDDEARRVAQVRLVKGLYERGYSAEQVRQLYRLMERMMMLPKPLAELAWNEIHEFEKEKGMTFITTAERVGMEKGLEKGREEGLLAGIELALELRFAAAGLALMPEVRQVQDADLLGRVLASIKQADTPEAVRQVWAKR